MRKILVIHPTEVLDWNTYVTFTKDIEARLNNDILVLNKNMSYEVVEIGE